MSALLTALRGNPQVKSSFAFGDKHHITVEDGLHSDELKRYLADKGFGDVRIAPVEPTVEDCFMALTSEQYERESN